MTLVDADANVPAVAVAGGSGLGPGLVVLFGAAGLLVVALAIGFWLPWHRVSITPAADGVRLAVRSWSPDAAAPELARLARIVGGAPPQRGGAP